MKAAEEDTDAVIPVGTDGKIHGLGGLYRKRAALTIENSLKNGERRVQKILKTMKWNMSQQDSFQAEKKNLATNNNNIVETSKVCPVIREIIACPPAKIEGSV